MIGRGWRVTVSDGRVLCGAPVTTASRAPGDLPPFCTRPWGHRWDVCVWEPSVAAELRQTGYRIERLGS